MGDFAEKFLRGMEVGRAQRTAREEHESNVERRKLEADKHRLEIRRLKHEEATDAYNLKQKSAEMQYNLLNGAGDPSDPNAADPAPVQFPGMVGDPEAGTPDVPGFTAQPKSARSVLQSKIAALRLEGGVKKEQEQVDVPEGTVPGLKGGKYDPKLLSAATDVYQSRSTASTAAANRANQLEIAKLPYNNLPGGGGAGSPDIDKFADAVVGGQYKLSDLSGKGMGPVKLAVMSSLARRGKVIVPPKVQEKMDAFTPAIAGLDKLEQSLNAATDPKASITDRTMAMMQFKVESGAFTRVVGRSLGEKGVFTDQDAKAFESLMSTGVIGATVAPDMAKKRLADLRTFMEGIQKREIDHFFERQGSAGPIPGPGNLPPKPKGKIRTRRGRPGSANEGKVQWSADDGTTWNDGQPPAGVQ